MAEWRKKLADEIAATLRTEGDQSVRNQALAKVVDQYFTIIRGRVSEEVQALNSNVTERMGSQQQALRFNPGGGPETPRQFALDSVGRDGVVLVAFSDVAITARPTGGKFGTIGGTAPGGKLTMGLQIDSAGIRAIPEGGGSTLDESQVVQRIIEFATKKLITERGSRR